MVICVDKKSVSKKGNRKIVNNTRETKKDSSYNEEYGYDFIPSLNEWVNIDEQNKMVKRMENIE